MTREEAIKKLEEFAPFVVDDTREAVDMAIEALQGKSINCNYTCSDCVYQNKTYEEEPCHSCFNNDGAGYEPTEYEPVKHGEWETGLLREFRDTNIEAQEKADKAGYVRYVVNLKCSACGKITMVDNSIKYNFCPNCGAKMDK